MGRSQETFGKKEVRKRNEKKRKEKLEKRALRKNSGEKRSFDDMIAYVDEFGKISSTPPDPSKKSVVDAASIDLKNTRKEPEYSDPLRKGVVTFFSKSRGFGFIKDDLSGEKIFFSVSNLIEPVSESDNVEYEIGRGPRGAAAINVKPLREQLT